MNHPADQKNVGVWERIYSKKEAGSSQAYPCEDLIITVNRYCSGLKTKGMKVLDVGFGCGNNLKFLGKKGFDCFGVEISSSALKIAAENLVAEGLKAILKQVENGHYPFPDNFFDIVVAWNSLPYTDEESLERALSESDRILKAGGLFFATFATFKDSRVTEGRKISERTFEISLSNQKGSIIHAAKDEEQVKNLFSRFGGLEVGYSEITVKGFTISHWIICGRKNRPLQ